MVLTFKIVKYMVNIFFFFEFLPLKSNDVQVTAMLIK